jgi:hypothetical protein
VSIRDELKQLCAAHDRFMAEHALEPIRRTPVSQSDTDGLIYKDHDNNEPAPGSEGDPWAGWNAWLGAHLDNLRVEIENALVDLVVLPSDYSGRSCSTASARRSGMASLESAGRDRGATRDLNP